MRTLAIAAVTLILGFGFTQFLVETLKSWRASEQPAGQYMPIDAHAIARADEPKSNAAPTAAATETEGR